MANLRVGLVGANPDRGWGSGVHRRVIERLPGFSLQAVCTTRRESAAQAARLFGAKSAYTDADELVADPDVDVVSVCVLAPYHHDVVQAALEAGKHVYCEWPLTVRIDEADELAALARSRGRCGMVGLHLRGAPALRHAATLVAQGYVGRLTDVNLYARLPGSITRAMATRASGTTLLSIYGGHLLDALDHYFGPVADFDARSAIHLPPVDETGSPVERDAADHLLMHGALERGGALFSVDLGGAAVTGWGIRWHLGGTEGNLVLETADPSLPALEALVVRGARGGEPLRSLTSPASLDCAAIPAEPDRYPAYPGVDASRAALVAIGTLYERLGAAIRGEGPVEPDFARAGHIQRLLARVETACSRARKESPP